MSNFTQPICRPCWDFAYALRGEVREPVTVTLPEGPFFCCNCGQLTGDGIWIRIAPQDVRYPTRTDDEDDGPPGAGWTDAEDAALRADQVPRGESSNLHRVEGPDY